MNYYSLDKKADIKINVGWLWYSIVFLFALNFNNKAPYLMILLIIIGFIVILLKNSKFKITLDLLPIFLFSIFYFIILTNYQPVGMSTILLFLIGPIACFSIGYFIISENDKVFERTMLAIILGLFIHGLFNMIKYFQVYGFISIGGARVVPDIWTGINIAATMQGTYFSLISSMLFYSIFLKKQRSFFLSIILISGIIFSLLSSVILGNRTMLLILIISFLVNFFIFLFFKKIKLNSLVNGVFLVSILLLIGFLVYTNNVLGIKEFILNSTLYKRTESSALFEDSRFLIYQTAIHQMFDFPLGGYKMSFTYAHNLWLDVLNATGLIPFFFLLLYTLISVKNLLGILIISQISIEKKIFFVSNYLGFFLTFMVEPILEAVPFMFLMFILFNGMTKKTLDLNKPRNKPVKERNYANTMAH
ncbi:MAG: hypothetical protein ABS944_01475 [Solibacillus sp.]|uniref:hypothetical protein n=1 Tax=Solibacillus sp. TaxID=1909654 RepID=UPI0033153056